LSREQGDLSAGEGREGELALGRGVLSAREGREGELALGREVHGRGRQHRSSGRTTALGEA